MYQPAETADTHVLYINAHGPASWLEEPVRTLEVVKG
jgi:hypothetical protein